MVSPGSPGHDATSTTTEYATLTPVNSDYQTSSTPMGHFLYGIHQDTMIDFHELQSSVETVPLDGGCNSEDAALLSGNSEDSQDSGSDRVRIIRVRPSYRAHRVSFHGTSRNWVTTERPVSFLLTGNILRSNPGNHVLSSVNAYEAHVWRDDANPFKFSDCEDKLG